MPLRAIVAGTALLAWAFLIYAFGAGYFYSAGIWVPSPWNVPISLALGAGLVWVCVAVLRVKPKERGKRSVKKLPQ